MFIILELSLCVYYTLSVGTFSVDCTGTFFAYSAGDISVMFAGTFSVCNAGTFSISLELSQLCRTFLCDTGTFSVYYARISSVYYTETSRLLYSKSLGAISQLTNDLPTQISSPPRRKTPLNRSKIVERHITPDVVRGVSSWKPSIYLFTTMWIRQTPRRCEPVTSHLRGLEINTAGPRRLPST